jgi:hypothetical protein
VAITWPYRYIIVTKPVRTTTGGGGVTICDAISLSIAESVLLNVPIKSGS